MCTNCSNWNSEYQMCEVITKHINCLNGCKDILIREPEKFRCLNYEGKTENKEKRIVELKQEINKLKQDNEHLEYHNIKLKELVRELQDDED